MTHEFRSVKESTPSPRYLPRHIVTGDTLSFTLVAKDYLPEDGFTYILNMSLLANTIQITGTASATNDNEIDFYASPATTTAWVVGKYRYSIHATDSTDEYTVESGLADLDARTDISTGTDNKTHAQTVLANIEAVIENRSTKDQDAYSIAGRSLSRTPAEDLLKLRDYYADRVWKETHKRYKLQFRM